MPLGALSAFWGRHQETFFLTRHPEKFQVNTLILKTNETTNDDDEFAINVTSDFSQVNFHEWISSSKLTNFAPLDSYADFGAKIQIFLKLAVLK